MQPMYIRPQNFNSDMDLIGRHVNLRTSAYLPRAVNFVLFFWVRFVSSVNSQGSVPSEPEEPLDYGIVGRPKLLRDARQRQAAYVMG